MKEYLIETFNYNDTANKKLLNKILQLPDKTASIKLFSHLINCQFKWMARILQDPNAPQMSWWDPIYSEEHLESEWSKSLNTWLAYLKSEGDEKLNAEVSFIGFDQVKWAVSPRDIALQLNYHSIHHRAQIQTIIRQQGLEPDFLDYIGTKYRRLSD
ncbi:MAG: DinB family protein [Saprospiraceae bacterium]